MLRSFSRTPLVAVRGMHRLGQLNRGHVPLSAFGALTLAAGIAGSLSLSDNRELITWSFTHWAFSYDHGFVKRGLVGELLSQVIEPQSLFRTVWVASLMIAVATATALLYVFVRPFRRFRHPGLLAFAVVTVTHFGTLQHFFYDLGRFDNLGLFLALLCLACIDRCGRGVSSVVIVTACAIGIVIHEAFVVVSLPMVLAYWWYRDAGPGGISYRHAAVALALVVVALLMVSRGSPGLAQADYVRELRAEHGDWINPGSVSVLYGGVETESNRAIRNLLTPRRIIQHVVLAAFLFPSLLLVVLACRGGSGAGVPPPRLDVRGVLTVVACCSPLALYVVGVDFARWWALALTNVFVMLACLAVSSETWRERVGDAFSRHAGLVWSAVALNLIAGPLGVASSPFPRIDPLITAAVTTLLHAVR
jgi:hypothetical protein